MASGVSGSARDILPPRRFLFTVTVNFYQLKLFIRRQKFLTNTTFPCRSWFMTLCDKVSGLRRASHFLLILEKGQSITRITIRFTSLCLKSIMFMPLQSTAKAMSGMGATMIHRSISGIGGKTLLKSTSSWTES